MLYVWPRLTPVHSVCTITHLIAFQVMGVLTKDKAVEYMNAGDELVEAAAAAAEAAKEEMLQGQQQ